ncbi:11640_t:CDS:1, partial [Racocetra fulgida]
MSTQDPQKIEVTALSDKGALKSSRSIKFDFNINITSIFVPDNNANEVAALPYF